MININFCKVLALKLKTEVCCYLKCPKVITEVGQKDKLIHSISHLPERFLVVFIRIGNVSAFNKVIHERSKGQIIH